MSDIKYPSGFGATSKEVERGYLIPNLPENPGDYATSNRTRWTQSKTDEFIWDSDSFKLRQDELESKGFLTRPVLPTER